MVSLREEVGESVCDCIVSNAKILLKHYLGLKYQFRNFEFWGEEPFHQWDSKIQDFREIIAKYK